MMKQFLYSLFFFTMNVSFHAQPPVELIRPPYLKKGDTVAIVATARKHIDDDLSQAVSFLEDWGLQVRIGSSIGLDNHQLAGTDDERAADFQHQLDDPAVKAIWCVRGGYGTVRIIDKVDFSRFREQPKWVIGFSDVTVLHSHLNNLGVMSLHAMMPVNIPKATDEAKESLRGVLFGERLAYKIAPHAMNRKGYATGQLAGGNLSILYSLLGSVSVVDCKDKILFLEDLDEYLYHVDRMMMNLKRNGCLDSLKGIVVGGMTKMNDNTIPWGKNALEIIEEITSEYDIPIAYGFPAGHIADNRALILGSRVILEVSPDGTRLIFEE